MDKIKLHGRVTLETELHCLTGLHIGGSAAIMTIGGVDNPIIRDPVSGRPYVPGSSVRGKMRSLLEKFEGAKQNRPIGKNVNIHNCNRSEDYQKCNVCHIFGIPGELSFTTPTRLIVRDAFLTPASCKLLESARTDLPYAELKTEVAIDRVTSAATPRQVERVPAGAVFGPIQMVYSIYEAADIERFRQVLRCLALLEDDYLGGLGSRGGGRVQFQQIALQAKSAGRYEQPVAIGTHETLVKLLAQADAIIAAIREHIPIQEG